MFGRKKLKERIAELENWLDRERDYVRRVREQAARDSRLARQHISGADSEIKALKEKLAHALGRLDGQREAQVGTAREVFYTRLDGVPVSINGVTKVKRLDGCVIVETLKSRHTIPLDRTLDGISERLTSSK